MFRFAQVSDPHFRDFSALTFGSLFSKRALGTLNLVLLRRRKHNMALLQAMLEDVRARQVDHLVMTGDLSNVSLTSEWAAARRWIEATGLPSERVTVIPGNHDAYVPGLGDTFERMFAPYQTADVRAPSGNHYPFVRFRQDVAFVAVCSGIPTGDFGAWGRLGDRQLADLEATLLLPEVKAHRRVVLIHHPPQVNRAGEDRNLRDREALQALLSRAGADLVLHGHDHRDFWKELPGPNGTTIPVVGVGSASYDGGLDRRSRYHVFSIDAATIRVTTYVHHPEHGTFVEHGSKTLGSVASAA